MKALMRGPHMGWHYHPCTMEWKLYHYGRVITTVAAEIWEEYKRYREYGPWYRRQ